MWCIAFARCGVLQNTPLVLRGANVVKFCGLKDILFEVRRSVDVSIKGYSHQKTNSIFFLKQRLIDF